MTAKPKNITVTDDAFTSLTPGVYEVLDRSTVCYLDVRDGVAEWRSVTTYTLKPH